MQRQLINSPAIRCGVAPTYSAAMTPQDERRKDNAEHHRKTSIEQDVKKFQHIASLSLSAVLQDALVSRNR